MTNAHKKLEQQYAISLLDQQCLNPVNDFMFGSFKMPFYFKNFALKILRNFQ